MRNKSVLLFFFAIAAAAIVIYYFFPELWLEIRTSAYEKTPFVRTP